MQIFLQAALDYWLSEIMCSVLLQKDRTEGFDLPQKETEAM